MNVWLVVLLDLALYLTAWAAAEVTPPSTRTWSRYPALPLMPPLVRWRLEIIAKIRHWDRNILPVGRQTDVAMLLPIPRTQVVHTSQTQVEHKSYTSRTQVLHRCCVQQCCVHNGKRVKATFRCSATCRVFARPI